MTLKIFNTLSRQKETFKPLVEGKVGMYVCGMTVYDFCHLGHARVMVAFDVIARYLRHRGYEVNYIRNITDIDDKIITRANENGEAFNELTERFIAEMHKDSELLGIEMPDAEPRATAHIGDIIAMVETLIEKGFAYAADNGDVYYSVRKFEGYGQLSGKILDELEAGARVGVGELKKDPLDFVLWKAAKPDEPHWDSPWGIGRPGWHIECSAMSTCCLGNTFDIHGGGPDLKFPHHENEIAQSEAATGHKYVNTWMHAGAVRVDGEKMSKSLGNFFTIREILDKYPAEVVRFLLLSSQYRSAINYSEDSLKESQVRLERFYNALRGVAVGAVEDIDNEYSQRFHAAMDDDFNTPEAIAALFDLVRQVNKSSGEEQAALAGQLKYLGGVLGCLQSEPETFLQSGAGDDAAWIEEMIQKRADAKKAKDFATADGVRDELLAKGIVLRDGPEGTSWSKQ
ncbi:MAG: cysteine--tRNA ligase [Oceanospirillaceae bacterium]|uniref:cysteine--tRNA ligase n=1 Tax=Thalassolituus sp. UBA1505 TaxID=1947653 RepID=UPI000C4A1E43|nr:cysteine--tRNA ligase [Thalassolituus sp. UBA1505]MAX98660.1 cysteine--tRNA ligase [Oceanospirillaceae bacterium]MBL35462.1 cysteine--tRNA ligase [Oceanospirillaceae bacterium]MBS53474.1 cysteine--tRNA ligase [Oceanospirillaceae bacterium]